LVAPHADLRMLARLRLALASGTRCALAASSPRFAVAIPDRVGETPREDPAMSIVVRFNPVSLTAETYDESTRQLAEAGVEVHPAGLDYHVCFGTDGNLQVSEVWDSREEFEAFGARLRLMPVLAELGIEFSGGPEIFDVHRIVKR